jgi:heat shock protein HtpX
MTAIAQQDGIPTPPKPSLNWIHSAVLVAALGGGLCLTAWSVAGFAGLAAVLMVAAIVVIFEPKVPGLSLMELYGAEKQTDATTQVSSLIDVLAFRAGLQQRPDLYVIPSLTLCAFSSSSNGTPVIAVTEGLLRRLTLRETAGILAHEMAHIRNGDTTVFKFADWLARFTPVMAVAGAVLGVINLFLATEGFQVAPWGAVVLLFAAPALSSALQLALSRSREDDADTEAVALTGDAMSLASAIARMENTTGSTSDDFRLPYAARRVPYPSLLRAHAPDKTRIARILAAPRRNAGPGFEPLVIVEQPMVSLVGYGPGDMRPRMRWPGLWF